MYKVLLGLPAIVALFMLPTISILPEADGQAVQGQVTIASTCGLSFPSGNPIQFDKGGAAVQLWQVSDEEILQLRNGGSSNGQYSVSGGDWKSSPTNEIMDVSDTSYASSTTGSGGILTKTNLTHANAIVETVAPKATVNTYWQMQAGINNTVLPFSGALTQAITFTAQCV